MDISSNVAGSVESPLVVSLTDPSDEPALSKNYMMKLGIEALKQHTIMFPGDINGVVCIRISMIGLKPVKNVSVELKFGMRNLCIQRGVLPYGRRLVLM